MGQRKDIDGSAGVRDAHTGVVPVRDSKVPSGPVLTVAAPAWTSFVTSLKSAAATA